MLYQVIITTGLIFFLLNLALNLKAIKTPRADSKVPDSKPLISVMIPARDEEANIRNCLESLQKQDYPNYEILVLDDNSIDRTAEIVSEMAAEDSRIRLFNGQPLAEGWAGKPFACHQLAQQAKGSWFLFVDADTTHTDPDSFYTPIPENGVLIAKPDFAALERFRRDRGDRGFYWKREF